MFVTITEIYNGGRARTVFALIDVEMKLCRCGVESAWGGAGAG